MQLQVNLQLVSVRSWGYSSVAEYWSIKLCLEAWGATPTAPLNYLFKLRVDNNEILRIITEKIMNRGKCKY